MPRSRSKKLSAGAIIAGRDLPTLSGPWVGVPDAEQLVHLQLRRFAGCPVCNLHLRSFVRRHDAIAAAGIREVVVFHSTAAELRPHAADLPFAVIADPDKRLYAELGAESSPRALLDPRAWLPILIAILHSLWSILRHGRPMPSFNPAGGRFGLPADFLIAPDGRLLAAHYGTHVDDHWSVDDVLALATAVTHRAFHEPATDGRRCASSGATASRTSSPTARRS